MSYKLLSVEDLLRLKQDKLSEGQLAAANSGITSEKVAAIPEQYVKSATVSQDGKTLTIVLHSGSTIVFEVEETSWGSITGIPSSFSPSNHASSHSPSGDDPISLESIGITVSNLGQSSQGGTTQSWTPSTQVVTIGENVIKVVDFDQLKSKIIAISSDLSSKASVGDIPYASTDNPSYRSCSMVNVSGSSSITIPRPRTDGKIGEFVVYVNMLDISGDPPAVEFIYDGGEAASIITQNGEGLSYETGAINAVCFSQVPGMNTFIAASRVFK